MQNIVIPPLATEAANKVRANWQHLCDEPRALGKLEDVVAKFAAVRAQKAFTEELQVAMLLMCGDHGIAKYGISAYPQEVTKQMIGGYMRETAGANVMARYAGADVAVVDVGTAFDLSEFDKVINKKVAWGTADFTQGPAMSEQQALQGIAAGRQVAEEYIAKGYNMLITAEMGIGNTTSTAAIASAYLGLEPELTVGRGTGINDERMRIKRQIVADGLSKNKPVRGDALDILCKVGGYDHAALVGMLLAGAQYRVPTMVDGVNATAAALIAYGLQPACADYMFCSHLSAETAHAKMLELLRLKPLVDAGMRLGEGTGAALAIGILRSSLHMYQKMCEAGGYSA